MKQLADWRSVLLEEALGLNPFAYRQYLWGKGKRKVKLKDFERAVTDQLTGARLPEPLRKKTIAWLYETCLSARVDIALTKAALQLVKNKDWRRSNRAADRLRAALAAYVANDLEKQLRGVFPHGGEKRGKSTIGSACKELIELLEQLLKQTERWKDWSHSFPATAWYRDAVYVIDKQLKKKYPRFSKANRVDVILAALNASDLRGAHSAEPTTESVLKILSRLTPRKIYRFGGETC